VPGCRGAGEPEDAEGMRALLAGDAALSLMDRSALGELASQAAELAARYRALSVEDEARVREVRQAAGAVPVVVLPLLRDEVRDLAGLARLAGVLKGA